MGTVSPRRMLTGWGAALALVLGCERADVRVYDVPKEATPPTTLAAGQLPPGHPPVGEGHPPVTARPQLAVDAPQGWEPAAKGEFRVASYRINGPDGTMADVSIIPLPAMPESDAGNVNRWRAQVGLPALTAEEIARSAQRIEIAGMPADVYELPGETLTVLGAIQHREGVSWYYKMTGHRELVAEQREAFLRLLQSVRFAPAAAASTQPAPWASPSPTTPSATRANRPRWGVPAGWTETAAGAFLVAKFTVAGTDGATGQVNISSSPGDGGGMLANINRWRRQLGLPEWTAQEMADAVREVPTRGGPATWVELESAEMAVLGAIIRRADETWFYKLTAPPSVVEAQREAFRRFVVEAEY